MSITVTFALLASVLALVLAGILFARVLAAPTSTPRANEIAAAIRSGAEAFLARQYRTVGMVGLPIGLLLWVFLGRWYAAGFAIGALASAAAGFAGRMVSGRANRRVAQGARSGFGRGFARAFDGGAVTGLAVVGAGLLSITGIVLVMHKYGQTAPDALVGLAFGGSLISVFARLGGGIFTKGADVGADLVGKIEAGIPEDDPRNPAVIADNVGDNVGDCAGMAADLFETYVVTVGATMVLIALLLKSAGDMLLPLMTLPLLMGGVCIITSIIGTYFVRLGGGTNVMGAMYKGFLATAL